jgi:lactate permease
MPPSEEAWEFEQRAKWPAEWIGSLDAQKPPAAMRPMALLTAWVPYMLVAVLLVASRLKPLGIADYLTACVIPFEDIFGTGIRHSVKPLYLPGTILILVSLLTYPLHRMNWRSYRRAWGRSSKTLLSASMALVFTVPMVQVFINSGGGAAEFQEMPVALAVGVQQLTGELWPLFSPTIGGIGAAVAGSNTISNMMFSLFQFQVGQRIGVDPIWVVALQAVGGAAGNTICVHNVVAALAVVGLVGREGAILRKTLIVFAYYATLSGALGYAIVWSGTKGLLNTGTIIAALIACLAVLVIATRKPPLPLRI